MDTNLDDLEDRLLEVISMVGPDGLYGESLGVIQDLRGRLERLTPEDIGLEKVSDDEHLSWPWYRYPKEQQFQPIYGDRLYWEREQ